MIATRVLWLMVPLLWLSCITGASGLAADLPAKEEPIKKKTFCVSERVYRMNGYDCSNMNLRDIPQNLKTNVEVFDASVNRISRLSRKSFARYTDIKLLYLFDNAIHSIEPGTFQQLTDLEAIDLSLNSLATLSLDLFGLPRLRNMYYNDNLLEWDRIDIDLEKLQKPIAAPLQKLSFAGCSMRSIPAFGVLPQLTYLNVSFNSFQSITPQQFSPLCSLKDVAIETDVERENGTLMGPCMCTALHAYFMRRRITVRDSFDCSKTDESEIYCTDPPNGTNDTSEFAECLSQVQEIRRVEQSKRTWTSIACGLAAFFIIFIGILYFCHRRNVRKMKLAEKQETALRHIHHSENGNVEVLLGKKT